MTGIHLTPDHTAVRRVVTVAALLAASGLALAGCKGSTSASGASGSTTSASASASASTKSSSGGSGGSGTSLAADFPIALGNTWVYESKVSGISHGTVTNKVTRVVPVAGGQRVRMSTITDAAGVASRSSLIYLFHSDGSITIPFSEFSAEKVKLVSGRIMWPTSAELTSGQPLHSTLVFQAAGLRVTAHVVVRGDGMQSVTVPAGSYRAQVVTETMTEKVEGIRVNTRVKTWVAAGVGPVKDEVLSSSAVPSTVEVLKSFTKA
jgi:hypothetical protein